MPKDRQQALFVVPRVDSAFTRETLRRGGPYEVMGKRWKASAKRKTVSPPASPIDSVSETLTEILPKLKRMR